MKGKLIKKEDIEEYIKKHYHFLFKKEEIHSNISFIFFLDKIGKNNVKYHKKL